MKKAIYLSVVVALTLASIPLYAQHRGEGRGGGRPAPIPGRGDFRPAPAPGRGDFRPLPMPGRGDFRPAPPRVPDYRPAPRPIPVPVPVPRPGYDRRGDWGRGRVIIDNGRYRYRPSVPFRMRPNPSRYSPYVGYWNDYIMLGLPYGSSVYMIGATYLSQIQDYDVIDVNDYTNCVRAVRLRVEGADANIDRVSLHFTDGGAEDLDVNGYYPAGSGDVGWRDLVSAWGERCIDSVVVIGETIGLRDVYGREIPTAAQALIEVWGLR